ncbi:MAG: CocE/NonD family hydrolase, partial [Acidimicrobiales bacterium]
MTVRSEFPFGVKSETEWIDMSDGTRLHARIRLPVTNCPAPAILEYLPYRKDDGTLVRDSLQHDYLAGFGFACVRVDIRGSGNSEGILEGEYLDLELSDAVEVIDWISQQTWCNGRVGMMGISWGGFNSLQVAALRPSALGAVVSVASTADRYATDVHYKGGCVLATDMLSWSATMLCFNARPPTPSVVGHGWRRQWFDRMERTPVFLHDWLEHQHRDHFWKHGSVCEDYSRITCPVLSVGGFADGYTDTVFHLAESVAVPFRGIVGPWSHNYPAVGVPGPNINFLQEVVGFFGEHLGTASPVELDRRDWDDPLRVWVQDWVPPAPYYAERAGRWVAEQQWPSPNVSTRRRYLCRGQLIHEPPRQRSSTASNDLTVGLRQGNWWGYASAGQLPADQRQEEDPAFRLISEPIDSDTTLLGIPAVGLRLSVDRSAAMVAVRLCDVAPDGSSLQLSRGVLNLTHRDSHESPSPMVPGEVYDIVIELDSVAHQLQPGHRLELLVSTSLWPLVWPSPDLVALTIHEGEATWLDVPTRPPVGDTTTTP